LKNPSSNEKYRKEHFEIFAERKGVQFHRTQFSLGAFGVCPWPWIFDCMDLNKNNNGITY
jgi:hypothetical protein